MNHYYATGAVIFEGPPTKHTSKYSYGSVGHMENFMYNMRIKFQYLTDQIGRADLNLKCKAPDGAEIFILSKDINKKRSFIYDWITKHGKEISK